MEESSFDIHCPECNEKNSIKLSKEIKCKKCETSFSGKKFFGKISCSTISKLLLGASLGVGGTVYSEVKIINHFSEKENQKREQKIPIPVERAYDFVQSCISIHRINDEYYTKKIRDNCFCAVEKLSEEYNLRWAEISISNLQSYYNKCASQ